MRILASSWHASSRQAADPLHDAIRLRHRALLASDPESRLLLLWSALERLTSGARGFKAALSAAKELVSHAVTFGNCVEILATSLPPSSILLAKEKVEANSWRSSEGIPIPEAACNPRTIVPIESEFWSIYWVMKKSYAILLGYFTTPTHFSLSDAEVFGRISVLAFQNVEGNASPITMSVLGCAWHGRSPESIGRAI